MIKTQFFVNKNIVPQTVEETKMIPKMDSTTNKIKRKFIIRCTYEKRNNRKCG